MADHIVYRCLSQRYTDGYENVTAGGVVETSSTSISIPGADTSGSTRVVAVCVANSIDGQTTLQAGSSWPSDDADVTSESSWSFCQTATGVGGGTAHGTGVLASAGSSGTFTNTWNTATDRQAYVSFAMYGSGTPALYDSTTGSGTDDVAVTLPIAGSNFYYFLIVQTANEEVEISSGTGWTKIAEVGTGTAGSAGSTRITIFAADKDSSPTAPTLSIVAAANVGESAGTSSATAVGASTAAAAGSAAGTSTVAAVSAQDTGVGEAAGTSTATAVGTGVIAAAGSSSGSSVASATSGGSLRAGGHGSGLAIYGASNDGNIETEAFDTSSTGSAMIVSVGRPSATTAAPTDNYSNTFTQVGSTHPYTVSSSWSTSLWADTDIAGGSGHVVGSAIPNYEELTIGAVEIVGGRYIEDHSFVYRSSAASVTSSSVTTTAAAVLVAFWWGEGPVGSDMTADPGEDWEVIESQLTNNNDGWIQMALAVREVASAGTYDVTWSHTPTQAANLYLVAVQATAVEGSDGSASGTSTPTAVGASTAAAAGAAAGTSDPTAVGASVAAAVGAADGTSSVGAVSGAAATGEAAGTSDATAVGASTATSDGATSGTSSATATGSSTAAGAGATAGTSDATAVGASTAASVGEAAGTSSATGSASGASTAAGAADGASSATAVGAGVAAAAGAATGEAAATAVGASTAAADATSAGTSTVAATSTSSAAAVGAAAGTSDAIAYGPSLEGAGAAAGTCSAIAVGASIAAAVGAALGSAAIRGVSSWPFALGSVSVDVVDGQWSTEIIDEPWSAVAVDNTWTMEIS